MVDYVRKVRSSLLSELRRLRFSLPIVLTATLVMATTVAAATLIQISTDPFTNLTSQHQTEVEPDTFSSGSTIVSAFQQGRFTDGGASDLGFATSKDSGNTWIHGSLPGITTYVGGTFARISDPAVAFDAMHGVWLVSGLALNSSVVGAAVTVSRSGDGGSSWANPVIVNAASGNQNFDKEWTVCDNTSSSPFYGHCYIEWDDFGNGNIIHMSTSSDGGVTWGPALNTADNATGIGGQPVVQPGGTVIVPIDNAFEGSLLSFKSTNGGASWGPASTVNSIVFHTAAGGLRSGPLPSATIDKDGRVYVVWQDCRFRAGCKSNDIVMTTSTNGITWSAVQRIPIDPTTSKVDHFIPGIAADPGTTSPSVHLTLAYYFYPRASCSSSSCNLEVGFVSSTNGGTAWSSGTQLTTGPMKLAWLAQTTQGAMVGDYISASYVNGKAVPVFMSATMPTGSTFHEAAFAPVGGLSAQGHAVAIAMANDPVLSTASDIAASRVPLTAR